MGQGTRDHPLCRELIPSDRNCVLARSAGVQFWPSQCIGCESVCAATNCIDAIRVSVLNNVLQTLKICTLSLRIHSDTYDSSAYADDDLSPFCSRRNCFLCCRMYCSLSTARYWYAPWHQISALTGCVRG